MALDALNTIPNANSNQTNGTDVSGNFESVLAGEQTLLNPSRDDLIAFVPTIPGRDLQRPTQIPGTQNPPVGVPPGHGQPSRPGISPLSPGLGAPGSAPYVSPKPSAGLDGLIQEGFGSRLQHEMLSILDGMISIARDSADGRSMITVPVGNANNPQGYVNLTYDRNTGQLYTSDPSGRDTQIYEYVPLSNLLDRLRLPAAGSDVYRDYESLGLARGNDGQVPAYPQPARQQTPPPETTQAETPPPVRHDPAPTFTGEELRDRIREFLLPSGRSTREVFGTDGRDVALRMVANENRTSDTEVAVALNVTYWDPHTRQQAQTWVGYFGVDPRNVASLVQNIDATNSFNVNNKDTYLTDSGLSSSGIETRVRRLEDRNFAANMPGIDNRRMDPVFNHADYEQSKQTIAANNATNIAAGRIDEIDLIIPAGDGRAAFIQDITRGNAVSLLNYAQSSGFLRDGVSLNSVVAANGLQDLIGVANGQATVKPLAAPETPQEPEQPAPQLPSIPDTPLLNPFPADTRVEEAAREYGVSPHDVQAEMDRNPGMSPQAAAAAVAGRRFGAPTGTDQAGGTGGIGNNNNTTAAPSPGDLPPEDIANLPIESLGRWTANRSPEEILNLARNHPERLEAISTRLHSAFDENWRPQPGVTPNAAAQAQAGLVSIDNVYRNNPGNIISRYDYPDIQASLRPVDNQTTNVNSAQPGERALRAIYDSYTADAYLETQYAQSNALIDTLGADRAAVYARMREGRLTTAEALIDLGYLPAPTGTADPNYANRFVTHPDAYASTGNRYNAYTQAVAPLAERLYEQGASSREVSSLLAEQRQQYEVATDGYRVGEFNSVYTAPSVNPTYFVTETQTAFSGNHPAYRQAVTDALQRLERDIASAEIFPFETNVNTGDPPHRNFRSLVQYLDETSQWGSVSFPVETLLVSDASDLSTMIGERAFSGPYDTPILNGIAIRIPNETAFGTGGAVYIFETKDSNGRYSIEVMLDQGTALPASPGSNANGARDEITRRTFESLDTLLANADGTPTLDELRQFAGIWHDLSVTSANWIGGGAGINHIQMAAAWKQLTGTELPGLNAPADLTATVRFSREEFIDYFMTGGLFRNGDQVLRDLGLSGSPSSQNDAGEPDT